MIHSYQWFISLLICNLLTPGTYQWFGRVWSKSTIRSLDLHFQIKIIGLLGPIDNFSNLMLRIHDFNFMLRIHDFNLISRIHVFNLMLRIFLQLSKSIRSVILLSTFSLQKCISMLRNSVKNCFHDFSNIFKVFWSKNLFSKSANSCMTSLKRLSSVLLEKSWIFLKNYTISSSTPNHIWPLNPPASC